MPPTKFLCNPTYGFGGKKVQNGCHGGDFGYTKWHPLLQVQLKFRYLENEECKSSEILNISLVSIFQPNDSRLL